MGLLSRKKTTTAPPPIAQPAYNAQQEKFTRGAEQTHYGGALPSPPGSPVDPPRGCELFPLNRDVGQLMTLHAQTPHKSLPTLILSPSKCDKEHQDQPTPPTIVPITPHLGPRIVTMHRELPLQ